MKIIYLIYLGIFHHAHNYIHGVYLFIFYVLRVQYEMYPIEFFLALCLGQTILNVVWEKIIYLNSK